jgi:hypothetical protein
VILLISLLHFMYWRSRHFKVLDQIRANPQARAKLDALEQERIRVRREELEAKGLNPFTEADPEAAPAKVVARERANVLTFADIKGWQGRAPTLLDTLPVWLFWLPGAIMENIVWMFKFSVFKMSPSNDYEANYLTAQTIERDIFFFVFRSSHSHTHVQSGERFSMHGKKEFADLRGIPVRSRMPVPGSLHTLVQGKHRYNSLPTVAGC